jgi:transposase
MNPSTFAKGNQRTLKNLMALRQQAQTDKAPRVALRIQGIMLSLAKHSVSEIARLLHVHRSAAQDWILAWNMHGITGLYEGHRSGRPGALDEAAAERLRDIVESGPVAYGLQTGVWTSPMIAQIIAEEFDVHYHPGHVRKWLGQIGCSVQRPRAKLMQADPLKQRRWTRYTYPNIKKKPAPKRR